jgi:hypothetical protein
MTLADLEAALVGIAVSEEAKDQARRIAAAIRNTFENNRIQGRYPPSFERNKGYWCYEWAYAFALAARYELKDSDTRLFVIEVESARTASGRVHFWIKITSLETGEAIYVDDAFGNGSYVNYSQPAPEDYDLIFSEPINPIRDHFVKKRFFVTVDRFTMPAIYDHRGRLIRPAEEPLITFPPPSFPRNPYFLPVKCFPAGTPVITPEGPKAIELLRTGDRVWAYDADTGRRIVTEITAVHAYEGRYHTISLRTATNPEEQLEVTTEHPFLSPEGWVLSDELDSGQVLISGLSGEVCLREIGDLGLRRATVYNLRTEAGNYLVGLSGLVVADRPVPAPRPHSLVLRFRRGCFPVQYAKPVEPMGEAAYRA